MTAMDAVRDGYSRFSGTRGKTTLISNYVSSPQKSQVNALLLQHVRRCFPDLDATLSADPALILLLLDAPDCATTGAILRGVPALAAHAQRVCIPQADPAHYAQQIAGAVPSATPSVAAAHLFNIRAQRLDQWLVSNRDAGVRVAVCFADYETSIYGKQRALFSPLRDLQLFMRLGYAHTRCLLGVTLGFREPHSSRYDTAAPTLSEEDLNDFIASEAEAIGASAVLLETVRYGLTFCLYEINTGSGTCG